MLFTTIFRDVNVTLVCITNTPTILYSASFQSGVGGEGGGLGPLFLNFLDLLLHCSGAPYPYRKLKETHELIFSWLSWLAVLLMGATHDDDNDNGGVAQDGCHTPNNRLTEACSLGLPCTFLLYVIMLWSIDTCQIRLSADQRHVIISRAQVYSLSRSSVLLKLTADQVQVFDWIVGSCQVKLLKTELGCSEVC